MSGYCNFSKSNNAIDAENAGLLTANRVAKLLKVDAITIREFLESREWHHTSCRYNVTDYYDLEFDFFGRGLRGAIDLLKKMRKFFEERKIAKKPREIFGRAKVEYWAGTRNHPRRCDKIVEGKFTLRGDWYALPDGSRKRRDKVIFLKDEEQEMGRLQ